MFVRKFTAQTLEEALKLVKRDFGDNALILSTQIHKGTLLKKGMVEVTAAKEAASPKVAAVEAARPTSRKGYPPRVSAREMAPEKTARPNRYIDLDPLPDPVRVTAKRSDSGRFEDGFKRSGFSAEAARELSHRLVMDFPKNDLNHPVTLEKLKTKLVGGNVRVIGPEALAGFKNLIAVGTPGSGKTSYLVKLSLYLREKGIRVALASRERRKITGPGEMAQYAKILKIPFVHDLRDKTRESTTLIDQSALTTKMTGRGRENERLLMNVDRPGAILIVEATQKTEDLMRIADHVQRLNPVAVVFTKADLASNLGNVYDFLRKTKIPLLGLSMSESFKSGLKFFGQLELASLILGGGLKTGFEEGV